MSKKGTPVLYANSGSLVVSAQDVVLKLNLTTGETESPVATVAFPLTFAARMAAYLAEGLRELTGETLPEEAAMPFEPRVVQHLHDKEPVYEQAQHPRSVVIKHASTIRAWRADGLSAVEIAERLHVSRSSIHRFLSDGVSRYPGRGSSLDEHAETIWQMRRQRQTYQAIGDLLCAGRNTVWSWCQAHPDPESNVTRLADHRRPHEAQG